MLEGVVLLRVAVPPLMDNAKSDVSNAPLPPVVLYTASENVTAIVLLSNAIVVLVMVGTEPSNVQLNWEAAELPLPEASVNVDPATSIVTAPSVVGVNVAV